MIPILERFKEPSSWASIATVLVALGINVDPSVWSAIVYLGAGAAALAGFFLKEKKA